MNQKLSTGKKVFIYVALTVICLFFLLPLFWILRTSLITKTQAYQMPPDMTAHLTFQNYIHIFQKGDYGRNFFNCAVVALLATGISVAFGSMASYWLTRKKGSSTKERLIILAIQMIPPIVLVVPFASIMKKLFLDDTWIALILAYLSFTLPYVIWMLFSFFDGIPKELDEAAQIDGCTKLQTYFRFVFPLVAPGLMATAVYSFLVGWNEFMFALVLTGNKTRTIPVAIAALETQAGIQIAELCAATIVAILPVILLSSFIKKYLIQGLTFGSIK